MEHGGSVSPDHQFDDADEEVIVLEADFSDDTSTPTDDAQTAGSDCSSEPDVLDVADAAAAVTAEDEDQHPETSTPAPDIVVKFTCPFCPEELGEKERWVDHVAKSHSAKAPTVCYICVRAFSTALGMNLHFSKEHPGDSLRPEFDADGIGKEDKGGSAMASFYSNLDAAIPKKGASRTIVVRRPARKSESAPEEEMERSTMTRKHSQHRSGQGSFKPRKPYTRKEAVEEYTQAPVKITGRNVVGAEYDEIQKLINELEPIPSQDRVGNDSRISVPMTRMNRKRLNKHPSANLSCPSCGARCENVGALQIHMFEKHDLLWCQRCKLKANETEMTEHLARKHSINKTASYSFLVEWNSRGTDENDKDSGNDLSMNVHTPNMEACDDASDSDEISIVFDNLIE